MNSKSDTVASPSIPRIEIIDGRAIFTDAADAVKVVAEVKQLADGRLFIIPDRYNLRGQRTAIRADQAAAIEYLLPLATAPRAKRVTGADTTPDLLA